MKATGNKTLMYLAVRDMNISIGSFMDEVQKNLIVAFGTCTTENLILLF